MNSISLVENIFGIISSFTSLLLAAFQIKNAKSVKNKHYNTTTINFINQPKYISTINENNTEIENDYKIPCLIILIALIPIIFKIIRYYQPLLITILIILSLLILLYNYKKIQSFRIPLSKDIVSHYLICILTSIIPIFSYLTLFAPMPFNNFYKAVFANGNNWLNNIFVYKVPFLYYLSIAFGFALTCIIILRNFQISRKFYKNKNIHTLQNCKKRFICLLICFITISGGLYWLDYGLFYLGTILTSQL